MGNFKMPSGKMSPPAKGPKPDKSTKDYMQPVISLKSPKDVFRKKK